MSRSLPNSVGQGAKIKASRLKKASSKNQEPAWLATRNYNKIFGQITAEQFAAIDRIETCKHHAILFYPSTGYEIVNW